MSLARSALVLLSSACGSGLEPTDPASDGFDLPLENPACGSGAHPEGDSLDASYVDDLDCDGFLASEGDCDDLNAQIHPDATELSGNRIDENCDGLDAELGIEDLEPGDLVITEIMFATHDDTNDGSGEWFEIANRSGHSTPIDLIGLILTDESGQRHVVDDFTLIHADTSPKGSFLVFGRGEAAGTDAMFDASYTGVTFEPEDSLALSRVGARAVVFDQVAWDGGATFPHPIGASMNLDPTSDAGSNDAGSAWCDGMSVFGAGQFGTPGEPNDACAFSMTFAYTWTPDDGSPPFGAVTTLQTDGAGRFTTGNGGEGSYALHTMTTGQELTWTYDNLPDVLYQGVRPFGQAFEWCDGTMTSPGLSGAWQVTSCP